MRSMQAVLVYAYCPRSLPRLLSSQLNPAMLRDIATCALEHDNGSRRISLEILEALIATDRFELAAMGLSRADKEAIHCAWNKVPGIVDNEDLLSRFGIFL